ncbi:MAG: hypothetical protein PUB22_06450 [Clostridiales bacterium]|nr:hypothetical protein [Clostridiales bacterium]
MNQDTKCLLRECNSGCKMAIRSMDQVKEYVRDEKLERILGQYKKKHEDLEERSSQMLREGNTEEKEPGPMAAAVSWLTAEAKLMLKSDCSQIAKLMMDGSNMGIQTISACQNKHSEASRESMDLARELVKIEESFMGEMKAFL